jgi:predicted ATPase
MKKEKTFKEKIVDKCWYKICYADGLKEKDKWKYAEAMGEEILALFEEEKKKWEKEAQRVRLIDVLLAFNIAGFPEKRAVKEARIIIDTPVIELKHPLNKAVNELRELN